MNLSHKTEKEEKSVLLSLLSIRLKTYSHKCGKGRGTWEHRPVSSVKSEEL